MTRRGAPHNASKHMIAGEGWLAFFRLSPEALGLGPHSQQLFIELRHAAETGQPLSVILLAATLADVVLYEGASYDFDDVGAGSEDGLSGMGLDWLSAGERRQLDWLRHRRNGIVHHERPVDGLMGLVGDAALLAADADRALAALVPVLEGLESF